nr:adenylyl-sulfate kinase [Micromonospora sp. DSM 115978]
MPRLVIITGPIAAGKNTVADRLTERLTARGRTVVLVDVDEVAAMVGAPGAGAAGLWFAAHEAHGALVGQWLRSTVDHVVAVGPFYPAQERAALTRTIPDEVARLWIVIDAPVPVTFARAQADPTRKLSRDPGFHHRAHKRFRAQLPTIPADLTFNTEHLDPNQIATAIEKTMSTHWPEPR